MLRTEPCMTAVLPRLILLSLLAVACSGADRGYLPVVGPPPIRFALPPPPPPAEPVVLPPWPQTDAQPVAATAPTTNAPGPTDVTVSASSTPSTAATAEATKPEKVPPDAVGAAPNGPDATAPGQLFQPFVTAGKKNGVGLGLALSRKTLLSHGGDLWAENNHGGACFVMKLPC